MKEEPNYDYVYSELERNPKLDLYSLWSQYKESYPDGLSYRQFCERFNRSQVRTGKKLTMHQERDPGKELFVDWMGETLDVVVDSDTGELITAHFFATALGNSGYPFVEVFPNEKQESWVLSHIHAFEYYGALPI